MRAEPPDMKQLGFYWALSQIGLEMVSPLAIGVGIDYYTGSAPWAAIVGALLGLVGGLAHLIQMLKRRNEQVSQKPERKES